MLLYNWRTIGHERELSRLEHDIATQNIASAYLFTGPQGVGKFTVARTFAGILQCEQNFCRTCATCQQVAKGSHPDTLCILPEDGVISIDRIRAIGHFLSQKTLAARKVVIIKQADAMTIEAANALLKNLEEPQQITTFFLTAQNKHELPETVLSRCRHVPFLLPPRGLLLQQLLEQFPEKKQQEMDEILLLALSRPGRAIALLRDNERLLIFQMTLQHIQHLVRDGDTRPLFPFIEHHSATPWFPQSFLEIALAVLRANLVATPSHSTRTSRLLDAITNITHALELLRSNVNTRMLLESISLRLSSLCSPISS